MAESSSSSDSERPRSPSVARTGQKSSRTFVWLRELPKAIPRGRPWDELNREGRVKEIEFGKKFTERQMRQKIKENFPELAEVDFKRIRLYKSGSRGSILKKVAKNIPDATQLLHKFKGGTSKRVYLILKNDDENGERSNSGNDTAAAFATQGRPNLVVPRDAAATRQYLTALSQSASTQQMDNAASRSPTVDSPQDSNMLIVEDDNSRLRSSCDEIIILDTPEVPHAEYTSPRAEYAIGGSDNDLLQSPFDDIITVETPQVYRQNTRRPEMTSLPANTATLSRSTTGFSGSPYFREGKKVGTVRQDYSSHGLGVDSNIANSRTDEVVRCEECLLTSCTVEDTSMPTFLHHSFEELCWQARESLASMALVLLNPSRQNSASRQDILRVLRTLMKESQGKGWLYWLAEVSSKDGWKVSNTFGIENTADCVLFLSPSSAGKPTFITQMKGSDLTLNREDLVKSTMERAKKLVEALSLERQQLPTRNEREYQVKERKARRARISTVPDVGHTICVVTQNGVFTRIFRRGSHFQEVYDWAGANDSLPLYFTLHSGGRIVTHQDTITMDETLHLTERIAT